MRSTALSPLAASWQAFRERFLSRSAFEQIEELRVGVPARHLRGLAESLNVPQALVCRLVGLSPSAAKRRIARNSQLSTTASERLMRIGAIQKQAVAVFGCSELAMAWLQTSNIGLGGVSPLSLLDTELGAQEVARTLSAIELGGVV